MQQALAGKRQLIENDRVHLAVYRAHDGAPRWHGSRDWGGGGRRPRRTGIGGQLRLFGRVIEGIWYR